MAGLGQPPQGTLQAQQSLCQLAAQKHWPPQPRQGTLRQLRVQVRHVNPAGNQAGPAQGLPPTLQEGNGTQGGMWPVKRQHRPTPQPRGWAAGGLVRAVREGREPQAGWEPAQGCSSPGQPLPCKHHHLLWQAEVAWGGERLGLPPAEFCP